MLALPVALVLVLLLLLGFQLILVCCRMWVMPVLVLVLDLVL